MLSTGGGGLEGRGGGKLFGREGAGGEGWGGVGGKGRRGTLFINELIHTQYYTITYM